MSFRVSTAASAAALLLIAPGMASAATEVFTASVPGTGAFTLDTFDTSLGTLNSVTLDFDATASVEVTIFNIGAANSPFTAASTSTTETVTGLGGPLVLTFSATAGPGTLPISFGTNIEPTNTTSHSTSVSIAAANFAGFETGGAGTVDYSSIFGPTFTSSITPGGATPSLEFVGGNGALDSGSLSVTYGYTAAVPEPAAWAFMILGFGGAGAMLRRRRTALA